MSGYVHTDAVLPEPGIGMVTTSGATPPFTEFVEPDGGGDRLVDFYIFSTNPTPCTVNVRTLDGLYTAGDDYVALDELVNLPGTDEHPDFPGIACLKVTVTVDNPTAGGVVLPYAAENAAFTLELYDPVDATIGGEITLNSTPYELLASLAAVAVGI